MSVPDNVKEQLNLLVRNISYLMREVLVQTQDDIKEKLKDAFKKKIRSSLNNVILWYSIYKKSIPDALLMMHEFMDRLSMIKKDTPIQKLNYNINKEIFYTIQRIYNL